MYKTLVYEKQIAQDVSAFQRSLSLGSAFQIVATVRPGKTVQEVEAAIDERAEAVPRRRPDEREIERARNTFETSVLGGLECLGGFGGVADTLNMFNHYVRIPAICRNHLNEHRHVSVTTVKAFAQQYLQPNARVVVHGVPGRPVGAPVATPPAPKVAPGTGAEAVNADEAWRKDKPGAADARPITITPAQSFTLADGLTVILQERPGVPIVSASLVVKSGGEANPIGKSGLASFMAAMLDQGTASRSAPQIADDVAQIGASLDGASSRTQSPRLSDR
jgi:zinc protease